MAKPGIEDIRLVFGWLLHIKWLAHVHKTNHISPFVGSSLFLFSFSLSFPLISSVVVVSIFDSQYGKIFDGISHVVRKNSMNSINFISMEKCVRDVFIQIYSLFNKQNAKCLTRFVCGRLRQPPRRGFRIVFKWQKIIIFFMHWNNIFVPRREIECVCVCVLFISINFVLKYRKIVNCCAFFCFFPAYQNRTALGPENKIDICNSNNLFIEWFDKIHNFFYLIRRNSGSNRYPWANVMSFVEFYVFFFVCVLNVKLGLSSIFVEQHECWITVQWTSSP